MRYSSRRRNLGDAALALGAVGVLLAVVVGLDPRVRDALAIGPGGQPSGEIVAAGSTARALAVAVLEAVRDQSLAHAPLTIFVLAAAVLVLFMLRT